MQNRLPEEKVFKDPVHHYVYVQDRTIWDLINTKEFQRLRRIRQLGASYFTFHGAEHSRFSHSLGVYEIARRIISQFERGGFPDWPREERLLCLCAALLHDVGHGPFSHSIEQVFGTDHEEWTCRIIREDTEVNRVLRRVSPDFPDKVAQVIAKTYPEEIVISIVSSQLDADRMDYLLRDAYFTGVNYGTFDLERILRMMRPHRGHLVIKESGMHAVEDYLMSRYQMYWQVYFHPVTRSSEIILRKIFTRTRQLHEQGYAFAWLPDTLRGLLAGEVALEDYLTLDEAFMQMTFIQWTKEADAILADLCGRFMHRRLFKYATFDGEPDPELLSALADSLRAMGLDPDYYLEVDFPADLPYDVYRPGEEADKLPVMLLGEDGEVAEISLKSDIVRSISGIVRGKHRLYFPGDVMASRAGELPPEWRKVLGLH
ncbi:HD domain-containing protein [Paenibacillus thermoaerophilus]|uniref:HD domain-containing protein n=1 Tax=Paenibacillus thermoaerophilus TaxID=1215385 RepID=A0ABW2VAT3_9BACL|nr:HD domain-containing protein [Paenibacillus thermoaerophilus]TMV09473.1 HD domain-containing protein [Paenibacillus thermoaerophilus]